MANRHFASRIGTNFVSLIVVGFYLSAASSTSLLLGFVPTIESHGGTTSVQATTGCLSFVVLVRFWSSFLYYNVTARTI